MKRVEMSVVHVSWRDAHSGHRGWQAPEDMQQFVNDSEFVVQTVGFLLQHDKTWLTVAMSVGGGMGCELVKVPSCCILKLRKIGKVFLDSAEFEVISKLAAKREAKHARRHHRVVRQSFSRRRVLS